MNLRRRATVFAAALWWGSLTTIFVVVPMLFSNLPSPAIAGQMAARLFSVQTGISVGCGVLLLLLSRPRGERAGMDWAEGALLFVVAGILVALLVEFGVAPRIVARDNLKLWHAVGSGLFVLQWLCAAVVLWKTSAAMTTVRSSGPS
ncbi:MAG: hypothetical protein K0Q43_3719 [Ramlibacter sp.]|nr:hypothetical protein [Ramlibacter sp.]